MNDVENEGFNPRPPSLTGEPWMRQSTRRQQQFQSTPAIADGRTLVALARFGLIEKFQSTPAIADGRTAKRLQIADELHQFQSTPAIADGRTKPQQPCATCAHAFQSTPAIADGRTSMTLNLCNSKARFNPRPPSLTGEPLSPQGCRARRQVSIHARHR